MTANYPQVRSADPYVKMIMDPCNAQLVPGLYGSNYGLLARFRNVNTFDSVFASTTSGYVIWFPSFHNGDISGAGSSNFFQWGNNSVTIPSTLANYGLTTGLAANHARSFVDPAYNFVLSNTCQDARTLSACMRVTYTGTTSNAQGLIIPLTNIPITSVLFGGSSNTTPTVAELMAYSTKEQRAIGTYEAKWRPTPQEVGFRDDGNPAIVVGNGTNSSISTATSNVPPVGIGFVFVNVRALSDFSISAYKNIEWRPEPVSGLVSQTPKGVENPSIIAKSLAYLDNNHPGWQAQLAGTATNIVGDALSSMVLGGASKGSSGIAKAFVNLVT